MRTYKWRVAHLSWANIDTCGGVGGAASVVHGAGIDRQADFAVSFVAHFAFALGASPTQVGAIRVLSACVADTDTSQHETWLKNY